MNETIIVMALVATALLFVASKIFLPKLEMPFWDLWRFAESNAVFGWKLWGGISAFALFLMADMYFGFGISGKELEPSVVSILCIPIAFVVLDTFAKVYSANYVLKKQKHSDK